MVASYAWRYWEVEKNSMLWTSVTPFVVGCLVHSGNVNFFLRNRVVRYQTYIVDKDAKFNPKNDNISCQNLKSKSKKKTRVVAVTKHRHKQSQIINNQSPYHCTTRSACQVYTRVTICLLWFQVALSSLRSFLRSWNDIGAPQNPVVERFRAKWEISFL